MVTIISGDKAKSTAPTDRFLSITLRQNRGLFSPSALILTIKDHIQLLIPNNSTATQVSLDITDFVLPADVASGTNYFVRLERNAEGSIFNRDVVDTDKFQILAAPAPGTSTGLPTITTPSMTLTTATTPATTAIPTTTTTTAIPTPTLPTGQTCQDVKEQCAAQGKAFVEGTATTPCACGVALIVPKVVGTNFSPGGMKTNVKSTFQSTGGPTAAFAVLLLMVMTLF
ncbi:hypothetical protein EDD11_004461 [Mortierella claussenii]|nr:hypothetical protein EDD11_004461 [Mortierella claussenii]